MNVGELSFSFLQMLSLIGIFQCVYVQVHIVMQTGITRKVFLPFLYFFSLAFAFFIDFAQPYIGEFTQIYGLISWCAWFAIIPLSYLLILQLINVTSLPLKRHWAMLLVVPLCLLCSWGMILGTSECDLFAPYKCNEYKDWVNIFGAIFGAIIFLFIWFKKDVFSKLRGEKAGKERYWLIISLIIVNLSYSVLLISIAPLDAHQGEFYFARSIMGLGFVYLVMTSLFRIYPMALAFSKPSETTRIDLTDDEKEIVARIEKLLSFDKVYQEATYSRSDLAQELNVSEATISKVINYHFDKSLPQILNEQRVKDAKQLLLETNASIKIVAEEVGFNSLPSFNRVFKEHTGQSPSEFRKYTIK